jgi:hypothetical protein
MVDDETETLRRRHSGREVVVRAPSRPPLVDGVAAVTADEEPDAGTARFVLELTPGARPASVLRALVASGAAVESFEPVLASMEEVFLAVVGSAEAAP